MKAVICPFGPNEPMGKDGAMTLIINNAEVERVLTMEGGSTAGYFAIRMKSDVVYETEYNGAVTQEKYCSRPGLFCGLILLTSIENGEPLAFINDGVLQHMRVGGDGGIGVKYMAR